MMMGLKGDSDALLSSYGTGADSIDSSFTLELSEGEVLMSDIVARVQAKDASPRLSKWLKGVVQNPSNQLVLVS